MGLIDSWKRRWWRADPDKLAALSGTRPAIVITGGSDGIGLELARAFAQPSHMTVLVARDAAKLEAAGAELGAPSPDVLTLSLDITTPTAADEIQQFLASHDLYADILINSAGIATTGAFSATQPDRLTATANLNVTALTALCRAFLPDMLVRGRGGIINVSSLGGLIPGPYQASYYASKAYVISLSRALAYETAGKGVRISCVAPGPVTTEFHARADGTASLYRHLLSLSAGQVARATRRGYQLGHTLIVPGLFNTLLGLSLRLLPGIVTVPIVAALLKPRWK